MSSATFRIWRRYWGSDVVLRVALSDGYVLAFTNGVVETLYDMIQDRDPVLSAKIDGLLAWIGRDT